MHKRCAASSTQSQALSCTGSANKQPREDHKLKALIQLGLTNLEGVFISSTWSTQQPLRSIQDHDDGDRLDRIGGGSCVLVTRPSCVFRLYSSRCKQTADKCHYDEPCSSAVLSCPLTHHCLCSLSLDASGMGSHLPKKQDVDKKEYLRIHILLFCINHQRSTGGGICSEWADILIKCHLLMLLRGRYRRHSVAPEGRTWAKKMCVLLNMTGWGENRSRIHRIAHSSRVLLNIVV